MSLMTHQANVKIADNQAVVDEAEVEAEAVVEAMTIKRRRSK